LQRSSDFVVSWPTLRCTDYLTRNRQPALPWDDRQFGQQLYRGIVAGLRGWGIDLLVADQARLQQQILFQLGYLRVVETDFAQLRPRGIFTHADNHHPLQEYILIARREGIPTVVLQHGLDCEQWYLDEAYASAIALWGPARANRYRRQSRYQPEMVITGNPAYDHLQLPQRFNPQGNYWLWVTRPHAETKCYSPTRSPQEGVKILQALLEALGQFPQARLVIKPHPADSIGLYQAVLQQHPLGDRVTLSQTPVMQLLPQARVVISEDSTAGLEAMFFGKPLIHAHFCESTPALKFVENQAALPGFSPEMLLESLKQVAALTDSEQQTYLAAQIAFLRDQLGPCDGQAGARVTEFVLETFKD
jgi:hypothetical protein